MRSHNQNVWELTSRIHAAEDAVKLQSASLMDVGRELRSALNTIVASCEVLRDADIGQANKEHAGTSIAAAEGLLSVANHALQAARLEANQSKPSVDSFEAGALADDVRAPRSGPSCPHPPHPTALTSLPPAAAGGSLTPVWPPSLPSPASSSTRWASARPTAASSSSSTSPRSSRAPSST